MHDGLGVTSWDAHLCKRLLAPNADLAGVRRSAASVMTQLSRLASQVC